MRCCQSGFRKESTKKKITHLHSPEQCACPCFEGSRVPDCRCPGDSLVTPLLQIRWKRLVIDEGHISGNVSSCVNYFVRQLSFERKWIVTGTPTSNILGLNLGRANEISATGTTDSSGSRAPSDITNDSAPPEVSEVSNEEGNDLRVWGRYDNENLRKLGTMIGDFLGVPPFGADSKAFGLHISSPLCDRRGPRPMAINLLSQVMKMVMVRHRSVLKNSMSAWINATECRVTDIEKHVVLPPMTHEIVYMDLSEFALKSYNAMQAGVMINAVDSEREGQVCYSANDYL